MILFYGEGRLGNQIFQYHALCQIARDRERIVAVGLEDLHRSLELLGAELTVLTKRLAIKRTVKFFLNPVLRVLSQRLRLFTYASETLVGESTHRGSSGDLYLRKGLFKRLTFVDGGHYQSSAYWTSLFPTLLVRLRAPLRDSAREYLDSVRCADRPLFVHVRRGDYLTHTGYGLQNLVLPVEFYRDAIREAFGRGHGQRLVFVTDDPQWVEDNFSDLTDKAIASFDADMDFAIMTECTGGILSNSTFSLAAALMLRDPSIVIGPKYWLGFRVGTWFPPQIYYRHPKLLYIAVQC